jgi:heme exporter protein D
MTGANWLDFLWADHSAYLWGSYIAGLLLVLMEVALLVIRERTILGHLGWSSPELPPGALSAIASNEATNRDHP